MYLNFNTNFISKGSSMGACSFQTGFWKCCYKHMWAHVKTSKKTANAQSIEIIAGIHLNLSNELTCKHNEKFGDHLDFNVTDSY